MSRDRGAARRDDWRLEAARHGRWVIHMSGPVFFNPGRILPSNESGHQGTGDQNAPEDDNAASAPGKVCELCGAVIKANQEARRRFDGEWIHEACPMPE
jgi:hypothetical protein